MSTKSQTRVFIVIVVFLCSPALARAQDASQAAPAGTPPIADTPFQLILPSEHRLRGAALAVSGATNWVANFAVTVTFLSLLNAAGLAGAYALYAVAAAISIPFVWATVEETKGKTLEQM